MNHEGVIRKTLDAQLLSQGYVYDDFCYFIEGEDKLGYLINIDLTKPNEYRVFVGVNYPDAEYDKSKAPDGVRLYRYFTGGGLSLTTKDFKFQCEDTLNKHLSRLASNLNTIIFSFFNSIDSLEKYSVELSNVECINKYEIYRDLGIHNKAREAGMLIKSEYKNMLDIESIRQYVSKVAQYLDGNAGRS